MIELLERWGFAALGALVVLVAALINKFAPARRRRIRRAFVLYLLFLGLAGAEQVLIHAPVPSIASWAEHVHLVGGLLAAFTSVELAGLLVFDLLLPTLGVSVVAITSDIVVGFAYIFAAFGVLKAAGVSASSVVTTSAVVSGVLALSLQATLGNILGGVSVVTITSDIVVGFAYIFAAFGVLKAAGVSASSVVTTSAVVSGVLALSLQATLGNILGGVALQLDGSIHVGDWVQLPDGSQGKVIAIRWRHTVLETRNWDTVIVPNANLLAQNIMILGKRAGKPLQHRMWVYFNVDFRYPPSRVIDVVGAALESGPIEGVSSEPKPNVICYDFAKDGRDSFAYYAARYWLTDLASDDPTSSRVRTRIFTALQRAGIPLARPARTVFVTPEEQESERGKRHRERRLHAIEGVELLRSLTGEERQLLVEHLHYAPFAIGETVTAQGAVAHYLYILCTGKVEVRRRATGTSLTKAVATIDAPGFFGEMGMLTGEPRRADVIALTDVECYRLDKTGLEQVIRQRPEIAEEISGTLAKRDVELATVLEGLDEEARRARLAHAETHMLDRIQEFFGLTRTTRV